MVNTPHTQSHSVSLVTDDDELILTKVVPTLSVLGCSYFHLTVAVQSDPATWPATMELNIELLGERGEPGTATVMVVSCRGRPSPSLIVSVAIFYQDAN